MANTHTFEAKICVVTGSASGIGKSLVKQLLQQNAIVHAIDVNEDALLLLAEYFQKGSLFTYKVDVRIFSQLDEAIRKIHAEHGRIDYLFNNAGITLIQETHEVSYDQWSKLMDINVKGVIHGLHSAYPLMKDQGFGYIINTASTAAYTGYATAAHYAASKAAILGLTESLRYEALEYNIHFATVCPGYVDTDLFKETSIPNADNKKLLEKLPFSPVSADRIATSILHGVAKEKSMIISPFLAKIFCLLGRMRSPLLRSTFQKLLDDYESSKK